MDRYCENCGAKLKEDANFCPECGRKNTPDTSKTCPNCGADTEESLSYCENCGTNLNAPQVVKGESFIEKYKLPLMAILLASIIILLIPVSTFFINESAGSQAVTVDSYNFKIPDNFNESSDKVVKPEYDGNSKHWKNGNEYIEIWVMPPNSGRSADYIVSSSGGSIQNKYGYTGHHNRFEDGGEAFSYSRDNKMFTIFVSDERLFDKIEVL